MPLPPKAKETHFKVFNDIYPSSNLLRQRFNLDSQNCLFCDEHTETTDHLFFTCTFSNTFWKDLYVWLEPKVPSLPHFTNRDITFGILREDKNSELLLNTLLILGKAFIHKCRCIRTQPLLVIFKREFALFYKSLKFMKKKGKKLLNIIENLKLLEVTP